MESNYRTELIVCFEAVQAAAEISRQVLSAKDKGVLEKDDLSPVTVADFAVQALLTATLHAAFPNDKFVGEESAADLRENPALRERVWELAHHHAQHSGAAASSRVRGPASADEMCEMIDWCGQGIPPSSGDDRVWVFDPIDGTKTFVRGELFAINVCLVQGGKQIVSAVGCPLLSPDAQYPVLDHSIDPSGEGSILFAVRGHGSYVRPLRGSPDEVQPRRLKELPPTASVSALRSVTCYDKVDSGSDDVHRAATEALGIEFPGCDILGWVPRWSVLALGIASMTVWVYRKRDRYAKIWDHAGAMLLYEETGGKITDVDGKEIDLTAGRKLTANYGFVAAPADVHAEVLRAVREALKTTGKSYLLEFK